QAGNEACKSQRAKKADTDSERRKANTSHQDERENILRRCSESDADPDFLASLGDEIGDDTVDADSGEEKSQPCEATDESYRKTARGTAVRNDVGQRANIEDRKIGIERFDGSANTGDRGGGIAGSTKNDGAAERRNLRKGNVGFNAGRLIDAVVLDV